MFCLVMDKSILKKQKSKLFFNKKKHERLVVFDLFGVEYMQKFQIHIKNYIQTKKKL